MPSTCIFRLSKPNDPYCSGEAVNGSITLNLTSAKSIKYLYIILKGEGAVSWPKSEIKTKNNDNTRLDTLHNKFEEVYVEKRHILKRQCDMEPGEYEFPFCLLLPLNCPSSFKSTYGTISYTLSVVLSARGYDKEHIHAVNVVRKYDLNLNPVHRIPLQAEEVATFGCCDCKRGMLVFTLNIPNGAYVSMQKLPYTLHIENKSLSDVIGYNVQFMQDILYTSRAPEYGTQSESNVIYSEYCSNSCPRESNCIFQDHILIPTVTPTTESRSIIRIEYKLKLLLEISRCPKKVEICTPIHIGTVPLTEIGDSMSRQWSATLENEGNSDRPPNYQYFKPPSFDEAVFSSYPPPAIDVSHSIKPPVSRLYSFKKQVPRIVVDEYQGHSTYTVTKKLNKKNLQFK